MWTGENGGFRKRLRHWHWHVPVKKQNGCFLIRFRWCSVDGRKRYKNASVDEKLFFRFQETENGGFRKRIFTRPHKDAEPPFSKTSTLESVFENLRFRRHTPPFFIVLVWKEVWKAKTDKKVCVFKRKRISVDGALKET